jgi:hypothetical protein
MFNEIKGYRITDKYTFIEPNNEIKKAIKISKYLGNRDEIMEWLSDNYSDLDGVQAIEEKEEILSNDTFGWTAEQREEYLIKAQKVSKIVNYTGWAIGAWTLLFPNPYEYAILASIIFPIVCLVVLKYFKGIITIDEKKGSAYPNIAGAILATTLALCLRAMLDFNIFDHSHVWIPAIAIAALFIAVVTISVKKLHFKNAKDSLVLILFSVFMFAYGYGAVVTLNCVYDKSEPETFNATILSKRISTGKTKTYYLKLTPWGHRTTAEEVSVSSNLYNRVEQEDTVNIYFRKGQFNIPWFRVTK